MSDRPIGVGDLVVVVRGHRCIVEILCGVPFRVTAILKTEAGWFCNRCGENRIAANLSFGAAGHSIPKDVKLIKRPYEPQPASIPLEWLKRIPPLAELESAPRKDEVSA